MADTWANIGRGASLLFGRMTSHISIVFEQKTIVFQNIGRPLSPHLPPKCLPLPLSIKYDIEITFLLLVDIVITFLPFLVLTKAKNLPVVEIRVFDICAKMIQF